MKGFSRRKLIRFILILMLATIILALIVAYFVPLKLQLMSATQAHADLVGVAAAPAPQPGAEILIWG